MSRRRFMGRKILVEVFEEITSTRTWIAPDGCEKVDAFVVGGGANGSTADAWKSAAGGRGGECMTYNNISVTPGQSISIVVGGIASQSYFMSTTYRARGAMGVMGGEGLNLTAWPAYQVGNA